MKKILIGLTLLASMSSFASVEQIKIVIKKDVKALIQKGMETGEVYSYTRSKLGALSRTAIKFSE